MKVVLDASSIINLINGGVFKEVLDLSGDDYFTCPLVVKECAGDHGANLSEFLNAHKIELLDESTVSFGTYTELSHRFSLGEGETECLCFCLISELTFCSDDRRARTAGESLLGTARITGSLGLMKRAVERTAYCLAAAPRRGIAR